MNAQTIWEAGDLYTLVRQRGAMAMLFSMLTILRWNGVQLLGNYARFHRCAVTNARPNVVMVRYSFYVV